LAFDFDTPMERAGTWSLRWERYAGRDIIPLWVADTDFRAAPAILEALAARVEHGVFGYTAAPEALRGAIAERLERLYAWRIEPEWLVFLSGVVPGLHLAARELLTDEGHALVPTPIYHHFKRALELAPRAHTEVPLVLQGGRWVLDEERLQASIRPHTRLLFLCNPHNPGGTVFTREELTRLAQTAERYALVLCSDEIHCELVLDAHKRHVPIASLAPEVSRRTVTLMSPSKAFNFPGCGCAWAIIEDAGLRRAFSAQLNAHAVAGPSLFGYVASLAAYRSGDAWLAAQCEYLRANRDLVESAVQALPALTMAHVEATYLAWIDCSGLGRGDAAAHFLAHGLALSPGTQFGDGRFVRLNFGTQRERLREALRRLCRAASST
jgi:cysteine-S-conjugate beta-lyase